MLRRISLVFLFAIPLLAFGQYKTNVLYKNNLQFGIHLHTNGYGAFTRYSIQKEYDRRRIFDADLILSFKHPREHEVVNAYWENARPYVYGKLNGVSMLRLTVGNERIFADIRESLGVKVSLTYSVGANLALLSPVYLEITKQDEIRGLYVDVERYDPDVHVDQSTIYGGASFGTGFSKSTVQPGFSAKSSLNFEWGEKSYRFYALEVGMAADFYAPALPIFAHINNNTVFLNLFLNLSFGKRW